MDLQPEHLESSAEVQNLLSSADIHIYFRGIFHTSPLRLRWGSLVDKSRLLKWPPFEILLIPSTRYTSLMTLLTCRFRLVAF